MKQFLKNGFVGLFGYLAAEAVMTVCGIFFCGRPAQPCRLYCDRNCVSCIACRRLCGRAMAWKTV